MTDTSDMHELRARQSLRPLPQSLHVPVALVQSSRMALPPYATAGAAAVDFTARLTELLILDSGETTLVPTGLACEVPEGFALLVLPRSGMARIGLVIPNSPGLIDPDYRGEIMVTLKNTNRWPVLIRPGDRIAQGLLVPTVRIAWKVVQALSPTARGAGGFGSTGSGAVVDLNAEADERAEGME